jgi:hypothetical protein
VVFGWALFRAESFDGAMRMWRGLCGLNGVIVPKRYLGHLGRLGLHPDRWTHLSGHLLVNPDVLLLAGLLSLLLIVNLGPNSQEIVGVTGPTHARPGASLAVVVAEMPANAFLSLKWWSYRPSRRWAALTALLGVVSIACMTRLSEFLYFQF